MDPLTRLYVELTTSCNLNCQMCVRHAWQNIHGTMSLSLYRQLIDQAAEVSDPPTIHLSGYGEPMTHPHFLECVKLAKEAGLRVELTTNGTLLNRIISRALLDLDLDRLVVSIDSTDPVQNDALRTGVRTIEVLENLHELNRLRSRHDGLQVDLAFVAMRSNIDSLPHLSQLAHSVGASRVIVSNLIAHTPELEHEILYSEALGIPVDPASQSLPEVSLPRQPRNADDRCPYAHEGLAAVRWDGAVCPCLSLLHDHPEYRLGHRLDISQCSLGNLTHRLLYDIWASPAFVDLRARLRAGDFSVCPCSALSAGDETLDAETVGASCLWMQGLVQVP